MQNSNCQICVRRYFLETHPTHPATALAYCTCEKVCRHVHQDWEGRERGREGSRVNSDFSWPGPGRVCTQHLLSPRATMARLKFLDFLYLKVSHPLLWKWIDLSCLYLEEDIVNNTFRRLLLPRLLGKHKNFATCANNSQKEVLAGQNVKLSNWLRIRNWTSSCPRLDQTGCCRQQICELGKLRQDTILLLGKALYQHLLRRVCSDRSYWSGSSPPERQCQRPGDHSPSFCPLNAQESGWIVKSSLP